MLRHRRYQHVFLPWLLQFVFASLVVCTFVACQRTGSPGSTASSTASATFTPTLTPTLSLIPSPTPTPSPFPSPTPAVGLTQRIDT